MTWEMTKSVAQVKGGFGLVFVLLWTLPVISLANIEIFSQTLDLLDNEFINIKATPKAARDPLDRPLYQIQNGLLVQYSIVNNDDSTHYVALRHTPLSKGPIKTNFLGECNDVFHVGVVAEETGNLTKYIRIRPGEKITNTFDLGKTTFVAATSGHISLHLNYELYFYDPLENVVQEPGHKLTSPSVNLKVVQEARKIVPFNKNNSAPPRHLEGSTNSGVAVDTGSYPGVPYWNYVCKDNPELHGYEYEDGSIPSCSEMANAGYCPNYSVSNACPVNCDSCADVGTKWAKPFEPKSYTTKNCSDSNKVYLAAAEKLKDELCASILYCMEKKTAECDTAVMKWFGGTSDDTEQWETLRNGYTKLCSSTNYDYICFPTENCEISFEHDDFVYDNIEQSTISEGVRDAFIQECKENGCSYSATVAWVYTSGGTYFPREINLCPIGFWIQEDFQDYNYFSGKASTIIHELSHFTDIAATVDLSYDVYAQLEIATTNSWYYLENAATWDNLVEDDDHGMHNWSEFAESSGNPGNPPSSSPHENELTPTQTPMGSSNQPISFPSLSPQENDLEFTPTGAPVISTSAPSSFHITFVHYGYRVPSLWLLFEVLFVLVIV